MRAICWLSPEGAREGERARKVGVWCETERGKGKQESGKEREKERVRGRDKDDGLESQY